MLAAAVLSALPSPPRTPDPAAQPAPARVPDPFIGRPAPQPPDRAGAQAGVAGAQAGEPEAVPALGVSRGSPRTPDPGQPDAGRPARSEAAGPSPTGGPGIVHVVRAGDTLWTIARRYQVTVSALAAHNGIADPNAIQPGQQLKVPAAGNEVVHVVRSGETLWEIALRYGIGVEAIARHNRLEDSAFLAVGQKLRLPVAASSEPDPVAAAAREAPAIAPGAFLWPHGGRVTSGFGPRDGRQHTGIDIAANHGDTVQASRAGTVTLAGWLGGYGLTVVIRHGDGTATLYGHNSRLLVEKGQAVEAGEPIARAGSTGNSTGPHVHFEIIVGTQPQDPMKYLAGR